MLRVGDRVAIAISRDERCASRAILAFNGRVSEITRIKRPDKGGAAMIELKGIKSKMGIPFTFHEDWVQLLEE